MAIEDIIKKIESETETKINKFLSSAKEEEGNILTRAVNEAEKINQKTIATGKEEYAHKKNRQISAVTLEAQKKLLAEKQKIVAEVYAEVLKRLGTLAKDKYRELLRILILKLAGGGEEIIIADNEKTKIDNNFLKDLNRELQKAGKKPLTLSFTNRNIPGGFILRSQQVEINVSFPLLIRSLREKTEFPVIGILFSNGSP